MSKSDYCNEMKAYGMILHKKDNHISITPDLLSAIRSRIGSPIEGHPDIISPLRTEESLMWATQASTQRRFNLRNYLIAIQDVLAKTRSGNLTYNRRIDSQYGMEAFTAVALAVARIERRRVIKMRDGVRKLFCTSSIEPGYVTESAFSLFMYLHDVDATRFDSTIMIDRLGQEVSQQNEQIG